MNLLLMTIASEEKVPNENEDEEDALVSEELGKQEPAPPPFFKQWRSMYMLVLGVWVLLILLFYIFTKVYQ